MLPTGTQRRRCRATAAAWRSARCSARAARARSSQLDPSTAGRALALKWYRPERAHPDQRGASPGWPSGPRRPRRFLWPLEVLDGPDGGFGYVMPLRPPGVPAASPTC